MAGCTVGWRLGGHRWEDRQLGDCRWADRRLEGCRREGRRLGMGCRDLVGSLGPGRVTVEGKQPACRLGGRRPGGRVLLLPP